MRNDRRSWLIVPILLLIILILIVFIIAFNKPAISPLPPEHEMLHPMPDDEQPPDENSVSMTYVLKAKVSLSSKEVGIYFANPSASNQDIVIELHLLGNNGEDIVLARSGLIPRGNSVDRLTAERAAVSRLMQGEYMGYYRVICYDSETHEKALVEPEITDVRITVID